MVQVVGLVLHQLLVGLGLLLVGQQLLHLVDEVLGQEVLVAQQLVKGPCSKIRKGVQKKGFLDVFLLLFLIFRLSDAGFTVSPRTAGMCWVPVNPVGSLPKIDRNQQ
jgi:hypothetical protein